MNRRVVARGRVVALLVGAALVLGMASLGAGRAAPPDPSRANADRMLAEGQATFRFDTFGDEAFWGGTLKLHQAVATLSPVQALGLGLKVDIDALPPNVAQALRLGRVNLNDPGVTLALLKHNAVVGVKGIFSGNSLSSIGITCALCHSTVDNSVAPGVGERLDGWANRDLNVGAIVAAAPDLSVVCQLLGVPDATLRQVLMSWGPGKFDAEVFFDGKALHGDGTPAATLIPPAFGLAGVNENTWTSGWGTVTYWNALVANLEMHGQGTFIDPRLDDAVQYPVAAAAGFGHVRHTPDLVTPRLPALHFYQLAIPAPTPPEGSFDAVSAARGAALFASPAVACNRCHVEPLFTEPGYNSHTAAEIGIDSFQSDRSPDLRYRTSPLKGLWTHQRGGFYHDGRFPTLMDVVDHYDEVFNLNMNAAQKNDLVEYLKSL